MSYGIGIIFLFLRPLEAKAKAFSTDSYLAQNQIYSKKKMLHCNDQPQEAYAYSSTYTSKKMAFQQSWSVPKLRNLPCQSQIVWPSNVATNCTATAASVVRCRAIAFGSSEASETAGGAT